MNATALRWSEAALAGAGTGLAILGAEGMVGAASRQSYLAALEHGGAWRLVAVAALGGAVAGLLGWVIALACGARGAARRCAALRIVLLVAALPVLVHPLIAPSAALVVLWPSPAVGAVLALPLLLAALLSGGRRLLLLPATAAWIAGAVSFGLLVIGSDRAPAGARADEAWLSVASLGLVMAWLVATAAVVVAPLAYGLRRAADGPLRLRRAVALQLVLLLGSAWVAHSGEAPVGRPGSGPPVLIIVADTLRADHVSGFGAPDELTPHLATLVRDGVSFTTAWSAAPWTTPSFGSLFTSRLPLDHGAGGGGHGMQPLHASLPTLAGTLATHEWRAAALTTNPLLGRQLGLGRGFRRWENALPPEWYHPAAGSALVGLGLARSYLTAPAQAERALDAVDSAGDTGWLVLAHFMDTHWPHSFTAQQRAGEPPGLLGDYRAATRAMDAGVGALLDGLRARGLYDGTLIVFTADHGEELEEHRPESVGRPPWNLHGHTLYEEAVHVPLIIKPPRGDARLGAPGLVRTDPVSLMDVMPTVLDLLGVLTPPDVAGRSLLEPPESRVLLTEGTRPDVKVQMLAARRDHAKIIVRGLPPTPQRALEVDLIADPGERQAGQPRPDHPLIEALMVRWLRLSDSPAVAHPEPVRPLGEDTRRLLQQLGYVR